MPTYRITFRFSTTTQERSYVLNAERVCHANDTARNLLNADTLGGIGWSKVGEAVVTSSS